MCISHMDAIFTNAKFQLSDAKDIASAKHISLLEKPSPDVLMVFILKSFQQAGQTRGPEIANITISFVFIALSLLLLIWQFCWHRLEDNFDSLPWTQRQENMETCACPFTGRLIFNTISSHPLSSCFSSVMLNTQMRVVCCRLQVGSLRNAARIAESLFIPRLSTCKKS